jgi:ATP:ADP antiporter, AAA family
MNTVVSHACKMSFDELPVADVAVPASASLPRKNVLEKALSIIGDVQPGEGWGVLILTVNLFTLLGTYYFLKTVRESLILAEGGAEVKAYSSAAQAILLLGVVPFYGWIGTHLNRNRLLRWTTLFFALNLILFYFVGRTGVRIGIAYYIWVGIFNVFSVAQLWSFATDLFSQEQGKRLFPLLGVGASLGAVGGAWIAGRLITPLGPYKIMLISAVALVACAALTRLAGYVITRRSAEHEKTKDIETLSSEGGFELLMRDRYLLLIAILTVLLNIVSLSGDFIFGKLLVNQTNAIVGTAGSLMKARKAYIGSYYASYYEWTNIAGFIIQAFLVSRIFKRIGVRGSLFVLPAISIATFVTILASPVLRVVRILKIAENSTNYSLQNTVRQALLLPTSREAKYKAKAAIDTFCVRLGDVLQAGVIFVGTALHFEIRAFAAMTLVITLLWLFVAYRLYLEHKHRASDCC